MTYGLETDELELMRCIFAEQPAVEEVLLYGSRAKGTYKPFSDVDITLKGDLLTTDDLTDVSAKLAESSLPYFCDVSLFRNLSSPSLVDHIRRRGRTIYKRKDA